MPAGKGAALGALILFAAFALTRRDVWGMLTRLPPEAFEGFSIFGRALLFPRQGITLGLCLGFAVLFGRSLRWRDLDCGRALAVMIGTLVAAQAWVASLYGYNLLVDRAHVLDRLGVLLLAALSLWRPAFVPAFLGASLMVIAQAAVALNALGWTNMRLFLDALMLFACFIVLHRALRIPSSSFFFVLLAMIGAAYFGPAVDKTTLGPELWSWHLENDISNIAAAGYANGWLSWLGDERAASLVRALSTLAPVLGVGTFLIEAAGLLVFTRRRVAIAVCAGVILLHSGIFLLTGILFWKWMLVDGAMLVLLQRRGAALFASWPWWMRVGGTVLIALAPLTFKPQKLSSWDTRLNQVVTVEVQDDGGVWRPMSPLTFAPFDLPFAQQRFPEVLDVPNKVGTFGSTRSIERYRKLQSARSKSDVDEIYRQHKPAFDERRARAFEEFVARTATTLNRHRGEPPLGWLPHAPAHIIGVREQPWDGEPIVGARVRLREVFFDGARFVTIEDRVIRELPLPTAPPRDASRGPGSGEHGRGSARDLASGEPHPVVDPGAELAFEGACEMSDDDTVTIALLADMKLHKPLMTQALTEGYESLWADIGDVVAAADIAYANLEGTLACCIDRDGVARPDPGRRWDGAVYTSSGRGGLNFHPSLAEALKGLGVDVLSTANNHGLDRGALGVRKTLDVLDAAGLAHTGTRRGADEPWHVVTEAKGMRVAWLACAEWTNRKEKDAAELLLNCTRQREEVLALTRQLAHDPDIHAVVVTPHGSIEEHLVPDDRLRSLARDLAEAGATVVASSHPHNLQTWEAYTTSAGRKVPLLYGRGNYLTFSSALEHNTSTLVHVGLYQPEPGAKATVRGVVHTPLYMSTDGETRRLVFIEPDAEALSDARALALSRYGTARLHPPRAPVDVAPECKGQTTEPYLGASAGEVCAHDTMCAAELLCVPHAKGIGLCTRACTRAEGCPAGAACAHDGVLGQRVCLRRCETDDECGLGTHCVAREGERSCAPHETKARR